MCKYTFHVYRVVFQLVESSQKDVFELLYNFYTKIFIRKETPYMVRKKISYICLF